MSPFDAAALQHARLMSNLGEILVWLGVAMELPEAVSLVLAVRKWRDAKRYISENPERPEGNWIYGLIAVLGLVVLAIGLSLEIPGHRKEVRITDAENRRLTQELSDAVKKAAEANRLASEANERTASLTQSNLILATQLEQTRSNQTRIDPQNLPITSIKANAFLVVRGTNWWPHVDPVKDSHIVTMQLGNRDWMKANNTMKLHLVCKLCEKFWGDDTRWVLEFGPDSMPSSLGATWNLTPNDSVRSADEWTFCYSKLLFFAINQKYCKAN
jgi:hypothetical protein